MDPVGTNMGRRVERLKDTNARLRAALAEAKAEIATMRANLESLQADLNKCHDRADRTEAGSEAAIHRARELIAEADERADDAEARAKALELALRPLAQEYEKKRGRYDRRGVDALRWFDEMPDSFPVDVCATMGTLRKAYAALASPSEPAGGRKA